MLSQNRIKALWICSWFPNRTLPNTGSFIYQQAKATSSFTDIAVLHVCSDTVKSYDIQIEQSEFLTIHVYYPKTKSFILKTVRQLKAQIKGYKKIKQLFGKPDIVHLNVIYPAGLFCLILHFWVQLPFIVSEHSSIYRPERQLYKGLQLKIIPYLVIKWAKAVVMLTDYNIQIMKNHWRLDNEHYVIVPNVIDTHIFKLKNTDYSHIEQSVFTFLHVSWLVEETKNVLGMIRSAALLVQKRKDFRLIIVGDRKKHPPLMALAEELNILNKFIFFKTEMPNNQVAHEMQNADAFLMFSHVEGLPCVILEAMSVGLPIIVTETGGISDWVTPDAGIILNIGDEGALVEAMNDMMGNRDKYDPSVIRSKIVEKCSVNVVGRAITTVYEDVLERKH